jgi:hypothetical protein
MTFRIFFDLSKQEYWHRQEWERLLTALYADSDDFRIVSDTASADCIILTRGPQLSDRPTLQYFKPLRKSDITTLVWDYGDFPLGRMSGFYCSLSASLFDRKRHRSLCYPITYNELVDDADKSIASRQYSFVGGITSRVRKHLAGLKGDGLVKIQGGDWNNMFDRSGSRWKNEFVNSLNVGRFILCPRGNGVGSVRLFEAMKSRRVPVIISDKFVLPSGIQWENCSVRVPERHVREIPKLLERFETSWPAMADSARRSWEDHFSEKTLLTTIGRATMEILAAVERFGVTDNIRHVPAMFCAITGWRAKAIVRKIQHVVDWK